MAVASFSCDRKVYHYRDDDGWILLCTEVDDLVITGTNEKKIESIRQYWFKRFEKSGTKDWGPIKSFLGINIAYDREAGRLEMDVAEKIKKLFEQHPILWRARPKRTPFLPTVLFQLTTSTHQKNVITCGLISLNTMPVSSEH